MIKAIETSYKGYRFRSRLEARWAVFFDTLRLEWNYELEGLKTSRYYLPDFLLRIQGWEYWVEVKPFLPKDRREFNNIMTPLAWSCYAEREDKTIGYGGLLLYGDIGNLIPNSPLHFEGMSLSPIMGEESKAFPSVITSRISFGRCPLCNHICILGWCHDMHNSLNVQCPCLGNHLAFIRKDDQVVRFLSDDLIASAIHAARNARFEHGETPKVQRGKVRK